MDELNPGKNTGFIPTLPTLTDWKAGGETGSKVGSLNDAGDWRSYESPGEWQKLMGVSINGGNGFETDACVTFSALDTLETLGNFNIKNGNLAAEDVQWLKDNGYCNPDGTLNFSDRFIAKLSGTTTDGNDMGTVWSTIRHKGLIPEALWPFPVEQIKADPAHAWDIYYAQVPQNLIDLGAAFAARFDVTYEWVAYPGGSLTADGFHEQLKKGPIQIATAVCPPWNTADLIAGCGATPVAHATMLSHVDQAAYYILDHYVPFDKRFAPNYSLPYAMRGHFDRKAAPAPDAPFHHTFNVNLKLGMPAGGEVTALQKALQTLKGSNGLPYLKPGVFGPYGPQTQAAVAAFQWDHAIVDVPAGANCGPKTRLTLNSLLS